MSLFTAFRRSTVLGALLASAAAHAYNAAPKSQVHQYFAGEAFQCLGNTSADEKALRAELSPYIGQPLLWDAAGKGNQVVNGVQLWTGKFWTYTGDGEGGGLPYTTGYSLQYIDMTSDSDMSNLCRNPANDIIEGSFAEDYRDGLTGAGVPSGDLDPALWEFWDHHFWNPESADDGEFSDDFGGGNGSAVNRAETYWRGIVMPNYNAWVLTHDSQYKGVAYGYVGRMVHLLEDISGPDHAHNDGHMPDDSQDEWELPGLAFGGCGFEDYTGIHYAEYHGSTSLTPVSYRIDDPVDPFMSKARQEWNANGFASAWYLAKAPLFWLYYSQAEYANDYPSNDELGEKAAYNTLAFKEFADDWTYTNSPTGKLVADDLVPVALRHVAGLYRLFYDTTHPVQNLVLNNGVAGKSPQTWFSQGVSSSPAFVLNAASAAGGAPFSLTLRPGLPYDSVALVARPAQYRDPQQAAVMYAQEMPIKMINPAYRHPDWKVLYSSQANAASHTGSLTLPTDGDYNVYLEVTYRADPYALVDNDGHHGRAYTVNQHLGRLLLDRVAPLVPGIPTVPAQTTYRQPSFTWSYGASPAMAAFEVLVTRDTGNPNVQGEEIYSEETPYQGATVPVLMEDGDYRVQVRSFDIAGNLSAWAVSAKMTVDATAPKLVITTPSGPSPYKKWDTAQQFRVAGWRHDYETGTGLQSIQVWNATWARAPAIEVSLPRFQVCTTPICPVPTWEDTHKVHFAYDVTVYDGPNELHVRVKDMLGNTTEQVLLVNYSHPAYNEPPQLAPGLQATTTYGPSPLWVRFNAAITDADLDDLTYDWTWGDGTSETTTTPYPSHVFYGTGNKLVSVTVTDVHGASVSSSLTITPQLITFIAPGSTVYGSTQQLAWSKVDWSDRYDVLLSDTTAGTSSLTYTTVNSLTVSTLIVGHGYQAQVRARVSGGYGPWSLPRVFNVVPLQSFVPTPLGPEGDVIGTLPTFSWTAVTGADQYEVQVVDPSLGGSLVVLSPMVGNSKLTWTMTQALMLGHTYQWRVHARVGGVFAAWSSLTSFTPHLSPPP